MKRILILFIIIMSTITTASSQKVIPEQLISFPVYVESKNRIQGSGFFFTYHDHLYLITAKHVLLKKINQRTILNDTLFTIYSYPRDPLISQRNILKLRLNGFQITSVLKYHPNHDIVALQIAETDSILIHYYNFIEKSSPSSKINTIDTLETSLYEGALIGNDVFIFGYPNSIGIKNIPQIEYEKPLLRKGIVAGKNTKEKTIILDCPVYPGNSGGPVFEVDISYNDIPAQRKIKLIGVISEFVPYTQEWLNKSHGHSYLEISNSGYSIVEPMDFVFEVLSEY